MNNNTGRELTREDYGTAGNLLRLIIREHYKQLASYSRKYSKSKQEIEHEVLKRFTPISRLKDIQPLLDKKEVPYLYMSLSTLYFYNLYLNEVLNRLKNDKTHAYGLSGLEEILWEEFFSLSRYSYRKEDFILKTKEPNTVKAMSSREIPPATGALRLLIKAYYENSRGVSIKPSNIEVPLAEKFYKKMKRSEAQKTPSAIAKRQASVELRRKARERLKEKKDYLNPVKKEVVEPMKGESFGEVKVGLNTEISRMQEKIEKNKYRYSFFDFNGHPLHRTTSGYIYAGFGSYYDGVVYDSTGNMVYVGDAFKGEEEFENLYKPETDKLEKEEENKPAHEADEKKKDYIRQQIGMLELFKQAGDKVGQELFKEEEEKENE